MKKLIILIILSFTYSAMSQSLSVFDVDASNFPTIKAKFYAFDKDGKQISNLSPSDFEIKENGQPRTVTNVSCPAPKPPIALSSVLVFDVSGSMTSGPPRILSAKNAANAWIDGLPLGHSECALVSFDNNSNIVQDFTTRRDNLKVAVEKLFPKGGTDYNQALIDLPAGGLQIAKTRKYKKIIVFLTDGLPNFEPKTSEIIQFAKDNQITIYAVTLDMPAPQSIKDMTTQTGGQYFENITTQKEAEDTYRKLLKSAQGGDPCEIEWESGVSCVAGITNVEVKLNTNQVIAPISYQSLNTSIAKLEINPTTIIFLNPEIGVKAEQKVTVTARNADFNVMNISSDNDAFEITPKSFSLNSGQSIELRLSYLPTDSSYAFAKFYIENDLCQTNYYTSGGFSGIKPKIKTLKLLHPNEDEEFVVGSDTVITWKGIPESDTVKLEYTIDNGAKWKTITDKASGLQYKWEKITKPLSDSCLVRIKQFHNDKYKDSASLIEWEKTYGGSDDDKANDMKPTPDNGYILAGYSRSIDGDISENKGGYDCLILKLDSEGKIIWIKSYGGTYRDLAYSINNTLDGGYIVASTTNSKDGDIASSEYLSENVWILKLDAEGNIQWQKVFGGNNQEYVNSIQQTLDSGFVFAAITQSSDGDITDHKGDFDAWIVKLDQSGNIQWQKSFGGTRFDVVNSIQQTIEKGYILSGYTSSRDGDIINNNNIRSSGAWIIKLNPEGMIEWQKTYGGKNQNIAFSVIETQDFGYIFSGETTSTDGDVTGNKGGRNYWIVKLNHVGEIIWNRILDDYQGYNKNQIINTDDGGYLIGGNAGLNSYDSSLVRNANDIWIIKLDPNGVIEWQKTFGGSSDEEICSLIQTFDGKYCFGAFTLSNDGDISENIGNGDVWVSKFHQNDFVLQEDTSDYLFAIVAPEASVKDIDMKEELIGNVKDSVITNFVSNTGTYPFRVDSIYFQGADANAFSLVSGFPKYVVEANQNHFAEFRFIPNRIGIHSAEIVIITQSDTLKQTIRGEGVQPYLNIENDLIDFGAVELQNFKDTIQVATIKNIGNSPLLITNTKHSYPNDIDFTTISGGGSFTLQPNEIHKMDLRFTAASVGRTSGTLEFHYNGVGSPAVVQLYGQGLGGNVVIPDDSAYAGDRIKVKLLLGNQIKPKTNDIVTNYKVKLSYNPTLLYCDVPNSLRSFGTKLETVEIGGTWDGKINVLGEFDFIVGLGNAEITYITLDEFHWLDKNNNIIDFDVEKQYGTFTLLGLCEEGGKRLVNPLSKAGIVSISPNPAENQINLLLSLSEFGNTEVCLYNILGEKVSTIYSENVTQKEILPVNSDLSKIATGQYIIIFRTPTYTETRQLLILR